MVKDIILNTKKNIKKYKIKNIDDVYNSEFPIVCFSDKMKLFDNKIKNFLKNKMYFHKKVLRKTNYGKLIIKSLFYQIKKNPKKYVNVREIKKANLDRAICDFIAGMTDRFAINLYNNLK